MHALAGTLRRVVPSPITVVPHPRAHAFLLAVGKELLHACSTDILVPSAIDEAAFPTEAGSQVDVLHLVVVVDARVLPDNPRPSVARALIVNAWLIELLHDVPRDGGLHDGLQCWAEGNGAIGRPLCHPVVGRDVAVGQPQLSTCAAEAIVFSLHGEGDGEEAVGCGIAEMASTIVTTNACLAYQEPALVAFMKEAREGPAVSVLTALRDGFVPDVSFFVTWLGLHPSHHRVALRTDEGRGIGRQTEARSLACHNDCRGLASLSLHNAVTVGNVIVEDSESDHHHQFSLFCFGIGEHEDETILFGTYLTLLALSQVILLLMRSSFRLYLLNESEVFAQVAHIGVEAEGRVEEHRHIKCVWNGSLFLRFNELAIAGRIGESTVFEFHIEIGKTVR